MLKTNFIMNLPFLVECTKKELAIRLIKSSIVLSLPIVALANPDSLEVVVKEDVVVEIDNTDTGNVSVCKYVPRMVPLEVDEFASYPELIEDGEVYYHHANNYECSEDELNIINKVVFKEAGGSSYEDLYIDSMGVMSVVLNRIEDERYAYLGDTPLEQLSAQGQFTSYEEALLVDESVVPDAVKDAVSDSLDGVRNHKYVSFRAKNNKKDDRVQLVDKGNNYFDVMEPVEENKYYVKK